MISDAYDCLTCIANHPLGVDAIIYKGVITSLCKAVAFVSQGK